MNFSLTFRIQGGLLVFLAVMLLVPLPFSFWYGDGTWPWFVLTATLAAAIGLLFLRIFSTRAELTVRDGFGVVTFAWIIFAAFGALPFIFTGAIESPIQAFFESMSGFTTTGSTVITDLNVVQESVLVWRSLTQWLGGMGIIVLSLAILPILGVGGMQLFEAEVPGPTTDRLRPRIQDTAKLLWGVYFIITAAEVLALMLGRVSFYEAVCHAFTTMATGGFSTRSGSVGELGGSYVQVVVIFFMFLAGVNFSLHYGALRGKVGSYFRSEEFRFYLGVITVSTLVVFLFNFGAYEESAKNLRDSAFQVVSLMTTTGYGTADYELWPVLAQYILVGLMFVGGCAGSTGGGMKNVRVLLLAKHSFVQLFRLIHPRRVRLLKIDDKTVSDDVIQSILGFFALYIGIFVFASLGMAALGVDLVTAGASVIACLSNIGPGLGQVGPTDTFNHLPAAGHLLLSFCMLVGRLEVFTVLVLVLPSFWRK
jgi:trk system potassium uptake protein TrkH